MLEMANICTIQAWPKGKAVRVNGQITEVQQYMKRDSTRMGDHLGPIHFVFFSLAMIGWSINQISQIFQFSVNLENPPLCSKIIGMNPRQLIIKTNSIPYKNTFQVIAPTSGLVIGSQSKISLWNDLDRNLFYDLDLINRLDK